MTTTPLPFEREASGHAAGVVTLFLEQEGRSVVVMDRALLDRIDKTLDAIGDSPAGLVIASRSERAFVAGADLREIDGLSDADLDAYLAFGQRILGRIAALPCTTVAAINGAALGGGLELALHCDVLLALQPAPGGKPYKIGLPEAGLGLCPGWGGTQTLGSRIDPVRAITMTASGVPMAVGEALELGLVESLSPSADELLAVARRAATSDANRHDGVRCIADGDRADLVRSGLGSCRGELPDTDASGAVVEAIETGLASGFEAGLVRERELLVQLRGRPEARQALQAFFERSKR